MCERGPFLFALAHYTHVVTMSNVKEPTYQEFIEGFASPDFDPCHAHVSYERTVMLNGQECCLVCTEPLALCECPYCKECGEKGNPMCYANHELRHWSKYRGFYLKTEYDIKSKLDGREIVLQCCHPNAGYFHQLIEPRRDVAETDVLAFRPTTKGSMKRFTDSKEALEQTLKNRGKK